MHKLDRIITPTVTGIVITVIGLSLINLSLIKVGFTDFAGGAQPGEALGSPVNLLLGCIVGAAILNLTFRGSPSVTGDAPDPVSPVLRSVPSPEAVMSLRSRSARAAGARPALVRLR